MFKLRASFNFTESDIRYAIENEDVYTITSAARFLHCSPEIFRKYAAMYYDHTVGKSLLQILKDKKRKNRGNVNCGYSPLNAPMENILTGLHPGYNVEKLQNRLIVEGYLLEQCNICGFHGRRVTDYKVPLKLAFIDKNSRNHLLENMELVCYNCYFLYYGELMGRRYRIDPRLYKSNRNIQQISADEPIR